MAIIFAPPTRAGRLLARRKDRSAFDLFKHFLPMEEGINVYLLANGTYIEDDGLAAESAVTKTYHGAHLHEITAAERTALTAAGYGAYITET